MATHTVKFSGPITWPAGVGNDVAGVSFTNSNGAKTAVVTADATLGKDTDTIVYTVVWTGGDPADGEVVTYTYTPGVYYEVGGDPVEDAMGDASLVLTNCADVPPQPPSEGNQISPIGGTITGFGGTLTIERMKSVYYSGTRANTNRFQ